MTLPRDPLPMLFAPRARLDLEEIWLYVAEQDVERADALIDRIVRQCETLAQFPEMGKRRPDLARGLRSFPVGDYLIFYRPEIDVLDIVRVLSGYRDIEGVFD